MKKYPGVIDAWLVRLDVYLGATLEVLIDGNFRSAKNYLPTRLDL
ncbi:hypothetical protein [Thermococcus sp.]|nr:hypothetical protein [Thermococcus sp.]